MFVFVFEECAWLDGNGCVSECLYNTILERRLWTVEKDVQGLTSNVRDNDRLLERPLLPGDLGVFVEHAYKRFLSVLS